MVKRMDQSTQVKKRGRPRKYPRPSEAMTQEPATAVDVNTETRFKSARIKRAAKAVNSSVIPKTRPVRASATKARSTIKDAFTDPFAMKKQPHEASHDKLPEAGSNVGVTEPVVSTEDPVATRYSSPTPSNDNQEAGKDRTSDPAAEAGAVAHAPKLMGGDNEPADAGHSSPLSADNAEAGHNKFFDLATEADAVSGVAEPIVSESKPLEADYTLNVSSAAEPATGRNDTFEQALEVDTAVHATAPPVAINEPAEARHSPPVSTAELETSRDRALPTSTAEEKLGKEVPALHTIEAAPDSATKENREFLEQVEFPTPYEDEGEGDDEDEEEANAAETVNISRILGRKITPLEQFQLLFEKPKQRTTPQLHLITSHGQEVLKAWQNEWMALERHIQGEAAKEPRIGSWEGDEDHKQAVLGGYKPRGHGKQGKPWPWIAPAFPEPDMGRQTRQSTRIRGRENSLAPAFSAAPTAGRVRKSGTIVLTEPEGAQVATKRRQVLEEEEPPKEEVSTVAPGPVLLAAPTRGAGRKRAALALGIEEGKTLEISGKRRRLSSVPALATSAAATVPKRRGRPPKKVSAKA